MESIIVKQKEARQLAHEVIDSTRRSGRSLALLTFLLGLLAGLGGAVAMFEMAR